MQLPSLPAETISNAHSLLSAELEFTLLEKKMIGQAGLFLNALNVLEMDNLAVALHDKNFVSINDTIKSSLNALEATVSHFGDEHQITLDTQLSVKTKYDDSDDKNNQCLCFSLKADSYGYDIKPYELLNEHDRNIMVSCIAEIRSLLMYCPNVSDVQEMAGFELEVFEHLDDVIHKCYDISNEDAVVTFMDNNPEALESYEGWFDPDELPYSYVQHKTGLPEWVERLNVAKGDKSPFKALEMLKELQGKSTRQDINAFVDKTTQSISDLLRDVPDLASWQDIKDASHHLSTGIESDDPALDFGFMLCWDDSGYFWGVHEQLYRSMMEAGETPTYYAWATPDNAHLVQKTIERFYRGAALLQDVSNLAVNIAAELRN